ncbi:MAG: Wzz/FepE/Etk N-terminal domain-containing protein [Gemmatimonadaceae bacterium]
MSILSLALARLWARRILVFFVLLAAALVGSAVALALPNVYTARAAFYSEGKTAPDISSMAGGLGGLGALMALAGGSSAGSQTGFFVDLLKSQTFFDSLGASVLPIGPSGSGVTVRSYVVKKAKNEAQRRWKSRIALKKMIEVAREPSGIVVVSVEAKSPVAAAAIANRSVDVIDALNLRFRRDQAAARRRFTEAFRSDVERRLSTSEYQLQDFLSSNRSQLSMRSASLNPVLQSREDRLRAEVARLRGLKEQLESTIENARLTEFNDAPVVARIDRSPPPEKRSGPPRMLIALGTVLLAGTFLFWIAFIRAARQPTR